jgi:hypothetical protein
MPLLEIVGARSAEALGRALQELEESRDEDGEDGEGRSGDGRGSLLWPPHFFLSVPLSIGVIG